MNRDLVSVVVACGGRVRYLEAALRSVAAQTDSDWEIVLVNDARSPEVSAVVARVGVPVTAVDGPGDGPASARNAGIAAARSSTTVVSPRTSKRERTRSLTTPWKFASMPGAEKRPFETDIAPSLEVYATESFIPCVSRERFPGAAGT